MNRLEILKTIKKAKNSTFKNHIFGTTNKKLMSQGIISFDLPPVTTCPFKSSWYTKDEKGYNCFAVGIYNRYPNVKRKWDKNEIISKSESFVSIANESLKALPNTKFVRIHASGDYYSKDYLKKWVKIAKMNPNVIFYSYTKSAVLFKGLKLPTNFLVCQSLPLLKDIYFQSNLVHAQVFYTLESYNNAINYGGYIGAKDEDLEAVKAMVQNKNIALLDNKIKAQIKRNNKKQLV